MHGVVSEASASGKVDYREVYTKGSQTAKSGTDEQKRHMRLYNTDKQTHLCNVQRIPKCCIVDAAAIGQRKKLLPGEILE